MYGYDFTDDTGHNNHSLRRSPVTTNYGGAPSNLSGMTIDKYGSIDINVINVNSYGTLRGQVLQMLHIGYLIMV